MRQEREPGATPRVGVRAHIKALKGRSPRELRDRFLEQVNGDPSLLLPAGKYEVAKALPEPAAGGPATPRAAPGGEFIEVKALPAAA